MDNFEKAIELVKSKGSVKRAIQDPDFSRLLKKIERTENLSIDKALSKIFSELGLSEKDVDELNLEKNLRQNIKLTENMNNKLRQLIRESIQEYVKNIDEAGDTAALEAKMKACQEAIDNRKKMINMEGLDETMKEMVDKKKVKELEKEIKHLEKSLAKYEKQLEKIKNKGKKSEKPADEEKKEIVDEVSIDETNIDETFPENGPGLEETELNESYLHMQKLAGLITESEYKKKLKK